MKNQLYKLLSNARIFNVQLGPIELECCWGWENGEGKLGIDILNFNLLDMGLLTLFAIRAWVVVLALHVEW